MKKLKYADILAEHEAISKDQSTAQYTVRLLSNITIDQIKELLEVALFRDGISATVNVGDYDNIVQESGQCSPNELVVVFWEVLVTNDWSLTEYEQWTETRFEEFYFHVIDALKLVFKNLNNSKAVLFNKFSINLSLAATLQETRFDTMVMKLNRFLLDHKPANFILIDVDRVFASIGVNRCIDWRNYYTAKAPYTIDYLSAYAKFVMPTFRWLTGKTRKVLILDCDNTLWAGVLGEDGMDGIDMSSSSPIGVVFSEIQKIVMSLRNQGVIVGLCSKNNEFEVDQVIENHPDMLISDSTLAIKKINWNDKVENIEEISKVLNIGLDSVVFIDDSQFEIESVKNRLPMVSAHKVPSNIYEYPKMLRELSASFFNSRKTNEDAKRTSMYKQQVAREGVKSRFENLDDYLASLDLKLVVTRNSVELIERIAQMSQKTNQYNLTTIRYTEYEIARMINDKCTEVFSFSVSDKFGLYGVTGLCIVNLMKVGSMAEVGSFLMSCRIIGRRIEYAFFDSLMSWLINNGFTKVKARYTRTDRNCQVSDFYETLGFSVIHCNDKDTYREYEILVNKYTPKNINFIELVCEY